MVSENDPWMRNLSFQFDRKLLEKIKVQKFDILSVPTLFLNIENFLSVFSRLDGVIIKLTTDERT